MPIKRPLIPKGYALTATFYTDTDDYETALKWTDELGRTAAKVFKAKHPEADIVWLGRKPKR